jgi:hypothetical protein
MNAEDLHSLVRFLSNRAVPNKHAQSLILQLPKVAQGVSAADWQAPVQVVRVFRDFILSRIDEALQNIYRNHLERLCVPLGLSQAERIELLRPVEPTAWQLIDTIDWQAMADWLGLGDGPQGCLARLSALPLSKPAVTFTTSYLCNARCAHCSNFSGPTRREPHLSLERMCALIAEMPQYGLEQLRITGGEPFIYFEECLDLVRAVRAAGLRKIAFMTNGFWAKSRKAAVDALFKLQNAGFNPANGDSITCSAGWFYTEFVDPIRIGFLADAYLSLFGRRIEVRLKEDRHDPSGAEAARAQLAAAGIFDSAKVGSETIALAGRAASMSPQGELELGRTCGSAISLTVTPEGTLRTCCGYHGEIEGLSLAPPGNRLTLGELIRIVVNDPIAQLVANKPVRELLDFGATPPPCAARADRCGPCRHVLADLTRRAPIEERLFPHQRYYPFWFQSDRSFYLSDL